MLIRRAYPVKLNARPASSDTAAEALESLFLAL
jgi:hypothetical protein